MATLTLPLRTLHVLGVAVLIGAAAACWLALRPTSTDGDDAFGRATRLARAYEWTFWVIVAILFVTGISNVAAYGRGIPGPATEWGLVLGVKLIAVAGLLVLSVVRSLLVDRAWPRGADAAADGFRSGTVHGVLVQRIGRFYAVTAVYLTGLLVLAEVLAHG
jgi:uncharacterized membrane protein